jgi:hypothetical protein
MQPPLGMLEELAGLLRGQRHHVRLRHRRRLDVGGGVAAHQLPPDRLPECTMQCPVDVADGARPEWALAVAAAVDGELVIALLHMQRRQGLQLEMSEHRADVAAE